ncbi:MAG: hypothetical protein M1115_11015 [Actinobacteria bacterium]|nr:hypothetical protein [Actinomycetota bacterium]
MHLKPPTGPAFDVVLVAHVSVAFLGFGACMLTGLHALLGLVRGSEDPVVRRYFRPGTNWAERLLLVVPLFGIALVEMSHHVFSFTQTWVILGIAIWSGAALAAFMILWPAERRLQQQLSPSSGASPEELSSSFKTVLLSSAVTTAAFLTVVVIMFAKPGGPTY